MARGQIQEIVQASIIRIQHNATCFHPLRQNPGQLNHGPLIVFNDTKLNPSEGREREPERQHSKDRTNLQAQGYPR